jgi:hypothetical protein
MAGTQSPDRVRDPVLALGPGLNRHLVPLIRDARCACGGCMGTLGPLLGDHWRACGECGCWWKVSEISGHLYTAVVPARGCPG